MNNYVIERTDTFESSLLEIAFMIARNFDMDTMEKSLKSIEEHINRLSNPYIGSDKFVALSRLGYKVLVIPHNYVIYTIDEKNKKVILRLIIDDRQELYSVLNRYSLL